MSFRFTLENGFDAIASRNVADFAASPVRAETPAKLLRRQ